jgi:hypothetical protein
MNPKDIVAHLKREPFRPLRICISDGSTYDVPHPEFMIVTRTDVAIALKLTEGDLPDRMVFCDPLHITRILPLTNGDSATSTDESTS